MNSTARALIGFLVAPGVPALVVYIISTMTSTRGEAAWSSAIFAAAGYLAALVMGVPMYFVLQRKGVTGSVPYLALGALIGLICVVLAFVPHLLLVDWKTNYEQAFTLLKTATSIAVPAMFSGTVGCAVFWLIAIRRFD